MGFTKSLLVHIVSRLKICSFYGSEIKDTVFYSWFIRYPHFTRPPDLTSRDSTVRKLQEWFEVGVDWFLETHQVGLMANLKKIEQSYVKALCIIMRLAGYKS